MQVPACSRAHEKAPALALRETGADSGSYVAAFSGDRL